ncbi:hypothetical protein FQR65_LT11878 [Abscondita terminalis]|nr:hypothetical protein FQR65_LT11878 [Abscondita terminalis]
MNVEKHNETENNNSNGRGTSIEHEKENRKEEENEKENLMNIEKHNETETNSDNGRGTSMKNEKQIENRKENLKANEIDVEKESKAIDTDTEKQKEKEKTVEHEIKSAQKSLVLEQIHINRNVILDNKILDSTNTNDDNKIGKTQNIQKNSVATDGNEEANGFDNIEKGKIIIDPFQKHLTFPEKAMKKKHGSRVKEKLSSAISSEACRSYYTRKSDKKKKKLENAKLKKEPRKKKGIKGNKKEQSSTRKDQILCTLCQDELISDAGDDGDKNIGCDKCPRWYHLKCTDMSDLTYNDAAQKDYAYDICQ